MKFIRLGHAVTIAVLMLGSVTCALASEKEAFSIFVDNSYPPYMYGLNETQAEGLYPRLLTEVIKNANLKANIIAQPWKRALANGISGKGGVGGAYKNDERVALYDYSTPLYQERLVLFINKEKPFEFANLEDLKGKVIGVNRGWSYGQKFDSARQKGLFKVNVRSNPNENFKMLALGRIDCVILDQLSGDSYVQLLDIEDKVVSLPTPFSINDAYLIISKELNMNEFLEDFDNSLKRIKQDGTYNTIVEMFIESTLQN